MPCLPTWISFERIIHKHQFFLVLQVDTLKFMKYIFANKINFNFSHFYFKRDRSGFAKSAEPWSVEWRICGCRKLHSHEVLCVTNVGRFRGVWREWKGVKGEQKRSFYINSPHWGTFPRIPISILFILLFFYFRKVWYHTSVLQFEISIMKFDIFNTQPNCFSQT